MNTQILNNRQQFQAFPFHLVNLSPWPLLTSFSVLTMAVSAVLCFHGFNYGGYLLLLGFILTVGVMVLWFFDVTTEATFLGDHTTQVRRGLTIGFVLFVVSEVFAFLSVFWAFFHSSLSPEISIGSTWPPFGIVALDPFAIPLLNTVLLLSSGAFVTWAHHGLIQGSRKAAIWGTILTLIFAIAFTALQWYEYLEASFTFADSVFGSAFFASTGLHGIHVIIGSLFISVGLIRIIFYHFTDSHHNGFEAAILYWHFVDVVWLFLFLSVYYWGGN